MVNEKYKNKYRIESTRLQNWCYGWDALYFVTICTNNRRQFFGEIIDHKMILSEIGKMAEKYWYEIPGHFPFVKLHTFVVMPNHIHGIIEIAKNTIRKNTETVNDKTDENTGTGGPVGPVETQNLASLQQLPSQSPPFPKNKFGPQSQNLASIIRGYKIGVTKSAKKINPDWAWQSRFYDHIIRNKKSFNNISKYIADNPLNWMNDKFYKEW